MNLGLLIPEFLLTGLIFIVFGLDLFLPKTQKRLLAYISVIGLVVTGVVAAQLWTTTGKLYGEVMVVDAFSIFFKLLFMGIGGVVILSSVHHMEEFMDNVGEYYALILMATLGAMLLSSSTELMTAYIALELVSFSLYVMAAYEKRKERSGEAGVKYVLIGAFSSALLLYGMSFIYGITRTTSFVEIGRYFTTSGEMTTGLVVGLALVIAGLGFKLAAVPFHNWTPDVYEGSPLPVTAYLSVASKAAGVAFFLRLFGVAFEPLFENWQAILIVLSVITMTVGNVMAIQQKNIKRLLAYSSIGQAGYIILGLAAYSPMAVTGLLLHIAGYAVTNLAVFLCVIGIYNLTKKEEIKEYAGLAETTPYLAFVLSCGLFSLAGMPLFAGFVTKFYLFTAAVMFNQELFIWLIFIAVTNSLISLYYYLLIMKSMYVDPPSIEGRLSSPILVKGTLGGLLIGIFALGIYPEPFIKLVDIAARSLFG